MGNTLGAPVTRPPGRLLFVDWLRAWALLVMIETHVFNAFLDTPLRLTGWFGNLNFLNGLVAPSFLFVLGFVFLVAAEKAGLSPWACVVVEDAPVGVQAGLAAGMKVVGYVGSHSADRLRAAGVAHVVDGLTQITPELLAELLT